MIPVTRRPLSPLLCALSMLLFVQAAQAQVRNPVPDSAGSADVDLQGHRGARGLLPENSVPSMLAALDHGVRTLEVDVVVTQDAEVLVSHEPWMSSVICRTPEGEAVSEEEERSYNLFELDADEIAAFDCGSRGHPAFPRQRPTAVWKPLLRDVIRIADGYAHVTGRDAPRYNVEIKSAPGGDHIYHPAPDSFARLVYDVLADEGVLDRTTVQSFDPRAIRAVRAIAPNLTVALLVNNDDGFELNIQLLGFKPDVYSPNQRLVDRALLDAARAEDVDVIPWTVNVREDMDRLLRLGVHGIITDYPEVGREAVDDFLRSTRRN